MASGALNDQDGILRSISQVPPTHYMVKIQSFSLLTKNNIDRYESIEFEAGGYTWKLIIHPNGNKNNNVREYISVYLSMAGLTSLRPGWEVYATFRLFLLDQNKDNYLTLEDSDSATKGRRFRGAKLEWGFDQFIHHKAFNDTSNGHLVDDTCVFGAEVFVSKEQSRGKGESLAMIKDAITYKHTWNIDNFWKLDIPFHHSNTFNGGDQKWKIKLYRTGKGNGLGSHLSLYIVLADPALLSSGSKIFAEFTLRILDLMHGRHLSGKASHWFSASSQESGWARFISLDYFYHSKMGFLMKDSCQVEAEITIHGMANAI